MPKNHETLRDVFAEVIKAEYGSHTGKANMALCVLYTIVVIAIAIPKGIEIVFNGVLSFFGKTQLTDIVVPKWIVIALVVLIPVSFVACLRIIYVMETNKQA